MSQIEIHNVSYMYDKKDPEHFDAVKDISLNIEKGDFVAIVGKTGSGKSTLVQMLNGLNSPTKGYIKVEDFFITSDKKLRKSLLKDQTQEIKDKNKKLAKLKKEVGMVFQFPEYQLFEENVLKDCMFGPKNFGFTQEEAKDTATKALKEVGIDESYFDRSPFELSGGEKRRVAIAGIVASNPTILVLDEPTAGLDSDGKNEILQIVNGFFLNGKTIIMVTHDMDIVLKYAKKVIVLNEGKVVKITTPSSLFNETNLEEYSLEEPLLFKFKRFLKENGSKINLSKIDDLDELIQAISKEYKNV